MSGKEFEEKIKNAKEMLEKLMNPEITLQESLNLYKDGTQELKSAQKLLEDAKIEFETIKTSNIKENS